MAAVRFILSLSLSVTTVFLLSSTICSSQSDDEEALLQLKKHFAINHLNSWVRGSDPCKTKWEGILCSGEAVVGLHMTGLDLSGEVDVGALRKMPGLRAVSFINNSFTGKIPDLNKLTKLRAIYLSHNKFSGEIPNDYFAKMGSLKKVWLDQNKFTGKIPESLMQLSNLAELHLESNQFSGKIPPLKYPDEVNQLNLSENKLEGEIPVSLSKFKAEAFEGNTGLCGKILGKDCNPADKSGNKADQSGGNKEASSPPEEKGESGPSTNVIVIIVAIVAVVLFLLIIIICVAKRRKKDDDFSGRSKEQNKEEVLPVKVQEAESAPKPTTSRRNSSKRGSAHGGKGGAPDLIMVNDERGEFRMQDLMKAAAEVLGNGWMGSAYKAVMANGLSVVVKRMKDMNHLAKDAFDGEMRRFGKLRHRNILTPLAYHFRRDEKLIISEYIPKGSLLYVLHGDRGKGHAKLDWSTRLKIIKGIVQGLRFIHTEFSTYDVPHGNLKSSNVLLTEDYEPLLSDYAFQPLANPNALPQGLLAYRSPEYLQTQQVSPKSDVYCLGIIILEIVTAKFPSQYLNNNKGGIDIVHWVHTSLAENKAEELIDPDISQGSNSTDQMVELLRIGAACTESNPNKRLEMKEVIDKIQKIN